ncbi:MAG: tetratricopeptide repeat protein [Chromatium okenii]|uniref:Uncharacterized protein n=2 Tax=Chromatium okenii TaxID=61644 RepID=A0A2S7XQP0_9GAMM|nr:tetratricopeptide repeat protein [Chromatium okenii]PQJ96040.1 hypothetical protein CXB77_09390 [Chromatium okenii]
MIKNQAASTIRLPVILIAVTGLYACALQPREGPPAPVVQITPAHKKAHSAVKPRPVPVEDTASAGERVTPSKTVAPVKPKTKVYVYHDPSIAPDAQATAPAAEAESVAPAEAVESNAAPSTTNAAPATPSQTVTAAPAPIAPSRTPSVEIAKKAIAAPPPAPIVIAKAEPQRLVPPVAAPKSAPPPAPTPAPRVVHVAPPPPPPAPPIPVPPLPPAAQSLAAQAEQQRKAGDYTGAAASLERSLRIAPREAYLWNRLARVRMEQGQTHQAGNLASRANDLSGQNAAVKQDNWRIIAHSKRQAGDNAAANAAQQRADAN